MAHDIALHIIRIVEHEKASRSATIECGVPNDPDRNKSSIVFTREDAENVTVTIREKDQPPMKFTIMRKDFSNRHKLAIMEMATGSLLMISGRVPDGRVRFRYGKSDDSFDPSYFLYLRYVEGFFRMPFIWMDLMIHV